MEDGYRELADHCIHRLGGRIVLGLPLGLGKPNRLVNALYERATQDPDIELEIVTALSLAPPKPGSDLEARFLTPFTERHFGDDYPRLRYADDLADGKLPANVTVSEFYLLSGSQLGNAHAQRHYISSNYTHVARDLVDRGVNLAAQIVARRETAGGTQYSLSCNPDVTLDVAEELRRQGRSCLILGQIHPDLPFMEGDAVVGSDFFDHIIEEDPRQPLFAMPRGSVSSQDYAVGLNASALVADGGTLQIGIGSLSDALVHGLVLRQQQNDTYRAAFPDSLPGQDVIDDVGDRSAMAEGLYGASEMFLDGFMHLYKAGVLKREVFEDTDLQRLANAGRLASETDKAGTGVLMDGGFFLGSKAFYEWLRQLDAEQRPRFRMNSVGRINQLYGGNEELELLQRRNARFINSCMMVNLTGAVVSDGLEDHQIVSGVGGQYNFVAMAHAMHDGRSVMMLRSTRESGGGRKSNIVWQYPHTTVPRHLRDIVVTEYGIADLRGRTDEECIQALICIADRQFQGGLRQQAISAGKLDAGWEIPEQARDNTPDSVRKRLAAAGGSSVFPSFPFGSDFTDVEERLVGALQTMKAVRSQPLQLARALLAGGPDDPEALARMALDRPRTLKERAYARLLRWSLHRADFPLPD